ncbi:MAG TPA: hypothetical protein VMY41_10280 [Thermohalobaculum sp.]|nr:hypothetical protein [Thermohalobaculum sp.]
MRQPANRGDAAAFRLSNDRQILGVTVPEAKIVGKNVDTAAGIRVHDHVVRPKLQRDRPAAKIPFDHVKALGQSANGNQDHYDREHRHHSVVFKHVDRPPILPRFRRNGFTQLKHSVAIMSECLS